MNEPTPPLPSLLNPGPIDNSLLYEQKTHVSNAAWDNKEVVFQTRNTNSCPRNLDERVQRCLVVAGFYGLYHLGHFPVDRGQISSLLERWRPETHTFHMPNGECTITLQDIEILGGVRVDGNPVVGDFRGVESWSDVVRDTLGVVPNPNAFKSHTKLKLAWIKDYVLRGELEHEASPERVAQYTRGCILLLLGGQFLADKSGDSVKVAFVYFLANLEKCGEYSWGSAILANLYFEMCGAAYKGNTDIGGALIFLQLWAWHRLMIWTPLSNTTLPPPPDHLDGFPTLPYGSRLSRARARDYNPTIVHNNHIFPRDQLDMLMDEQFDWQPYRDVHLPSYGGSWIWRAKVPLICLYIVEYHYPNRVMRQFGLRQCIPSVPHRLSELHNKKNKVRGNFTNDNARYVEEWARRLNNVDANVSPHRDGDMVNSDYMSWYRRVTRLYLRGPRRFDVGFQMQGANILLMRLGLERGLAEFRRTGNSEMVTLYENIYDECRFTDAGRMFVTRSGPPRELLETSTQHEDQTQLETSLQHEDQTQPDVHPSSQTFFGHGSQSIGTSSSWKHTPHGSGHCSLHLSSTLSSI